MYLVVTSLLIGFCFAFGILIACKPCWFGFHDVQPVPGTDSRDVFWCNDLFCGIMYSKSDLTKWGTNVYHPCCVDVCLKCGKVFDWVAEGKTALDKESDKQKHIELSAMDRDRMASSIYKKKSV